MGGWWALRGYPFGPVVNWEWLAADDKPRSRRRANPMVLQEILLVRRLSLRYDATYPGKE